MENDFLNCVGTL